MRNKNIPLDTELPTMGKLIKSTILAICIAAILLVTVVLPAEYGIDPTGIGSLIGLSAMGQIKVSLAQEAADDRFVQENLQSSSGDISKPAPEPVLEEVKNESVVSVQKDEITFSLSPNEGNEIKLVMKKGDQANYTWWTDGGKANFDTHADSKPLEIKYHGYGKGSLERSEGVLEAAFDGNHGWFWRNRTSTTMTVTLQVNGEYSDIVQLK